MFHHDTLKFPIQVCKHTQLITDTSKLRFYFISIAGYFIDDVVHLAGSVSGYQEFVRFHPSKVRSTVAHGPSKAVSRSKLSPELVAELMAEFPYMTMQEILDLIGTGTKHASTTSGSSHQHDAIDLPADVLALVHSELEDQRLQLTNEVDGDMHLFTNTLGGEWAQQRTGHASSDIGSFARGAEVKLWCRGTGFPASKTYSIRAYGHISARAMAEQVAKRGNYFYQMWLDAGAPAPYSFDECVVDFDEGFEFKSWMLCQQINSKTYREALKIQQMIPLRIQA